MGDLILEGNKAIVVPSARPGGEPLVLDMREVYRAEGRMHEIQFINRTKAGELLYATINATRLSREHVGKLSLELSRAKRYLEEVRAGVVLDTALQTLKDKGLITTRSPSGSEDMRESVVVTSPEYQEGRDRLEQIQATLSWVDTKARFFDMCYFSIQKLIGPQDHGSANLSGGTGESDIGMSDREKATEFVDKLAAPPKAGFGNAKY